MRPVGLDNTFLSLLLNPTGSVPLDPNTGQPIEFARRRAEFVVEMLGKTRQKIIIPTPAIAELLTVIGPDAQQYYDIIAGSRLFQIAPFDLKCAIELAILNRTIFAPYDPKNHTEPYQKNKNRPPDHCDFQSVWGRKHLHGRCWAIKARSPMWLDTNCHE